MTTRFDTLFPRPGPLARMKRALRLVMPADDPVRRYFSLPYEARVAEIKRLYSHETKKRQLGSWLDRNLEDIKREHASNPRFYIDVVAGCVQASRPGCFMQLGSFVMTECQNLALDGFAGRLIASDYDALHLEYLKRSLNFAPFDRIEYRVVDLENPAQQDYAGVQMLGAIAVLSNIQPEGMQGLFGALEQSTVDCFVISDMYVQESLTIDPQRFDVSYPMPNSRNWCHPYQALARRFGFGSFFIPDFTYSSFLEARGIFVIYRRMPAERHAEAMRHATQRYLARHDAIWPSYMQQALHRPQVEERHRAGK